MLCWQQIRNSYSVLVLKRSNYKVQMVDAFLNSLSYTKKHSEILTALLS